MYDSTSARLLRAMTEQRSHVWCPQYGWHDDDDDHTDNDDETYARAARREADLYATGE